MHLLTLVVRCRFPKPLMVDPLTISLVGSLLQSAFSCVKFSCLPLLSLKHWCLFLLFTEAGRQRKPSHMDKLQSERGSQARGHRKASAGLTAFNQHCSFFSSSEWLDSNVVVEATKVGSITDTTKTQWEHTLHTLDSLWSVNQLERKPLNTHTLPAWFSACQCNSHYKTHIYTHTETLNSVYIQSYIEGSQCYSAKWHWPESMKWLMDITNHITTICEWLRSPLMFYFQHVQVCNMAAWSGYQKHLKFDFVYLWTCFYLAVAHGCKNRELGNRKWWSCPWRGDLLVIPSCFHTGHL